MAGTVKFEVVRVVFRDHLLVKYSSPSDFISGMTVGIEPIEFKVWGIKVYENDEYIGITSLVPLRDLNMNTALPLQIVYILKSAILEERKLAYEEGKEDE